MSNQPTHSHQLPGGGPGLTRLRGAGFLPCTPRSRLRGDPCIAVCPASPPGLTSAPQAFTLSVPLTASMRRFLAAFTSRSMTRPHSSQVKTRSSRDSLAFTIPQAEQVLELGKNRSATMSWPPCQQVL
jgi:hypothetical protein